MLGCTPGAVDCRRAARSRLRTGAGKKSMRAQFSSCSAPRTPLSTLQGDLSRVIFSWSASRRGAAGRQFIRSCPISDCQALCPRADLYPARNFCVVSVTLGSRGLTHFMRGSPARAPTGAGRGQSATPHRIHKNRTLFPQERTHLGLWRTDRGDDPPEGPTKIARYSREGENSGSRIGNGPVAHGCPDRISFRHSAVRVVRIYRAMRSYYDHSLGTHPGGAW